MTFISITACIYVILSHVMALQLLKIETYKGNRLRPGLAISIFMLNGQVIAYVVGLYVQGGAA